MGKGVGLAWVARGLPAEAPGGFFDPGAEEGAAEDPRPVLPGEEVPGTGARPPPGGEAAAAEGGRGLLEPSIVAGAASGAGSGTWVPGPGGVGKLPERVSPKGVPAQPDSPTTTDRKGALAHPWRVHALAFPPGRACERLMLIRFPPDE